MTTTLLEQLRATHEDIDRYERRTCDMMKVQVKTHREYILKQYKIKYYLDRITERTSRLNSLYQEKQRLETPDKKLPPTINSLNELMQTLTEMQTFYLQNPTDLKEIVSTIEEIEIEERIIFSGEEAWGRFLDLHSLHQVFVALPFRAVIEIDETYSTFLDYCGDLSLIPRESKTGPEYLSFTDSLRDYLTDFYHRVYPVLDLTQILNGIKTTFEEQWAAGEFPGWNQLFDEDMEGMTGTNGQATPVLTDEYLTVDLEDGRYACKACQKEFSKKSVFDSHFSGKKHQNAVKKMETLIAPQNTNTGNQTLQKRIHDIACNEAIITHFWNNLLHDEIERTKTFTEKRKIMKADEVERELEGQLDAQVDRSKILDAWMYEDDDEGEGDESEDDDDLSAAPYNPKNVPLGWDGKPIPYWLFKLNGLNQEFKCEICGNVTYRGPKVFEKHFQEWRHAHGMRALGIPNTAHFHHITSISEARRLFEKLRKEVMSASFNSAEEEEFEDKQGRVYPKKTYDDLKRQGLL
ncbi:putative Splicing factor 3A subunit 3 [Blattamonas nauphoetae]|uniref:Splicing factor 3A subunit 3 n=1 Tax=Blattamonas nauphoetae TaxID=2049346 RepID=A0ABQ9XJ15_9EUKA|nr:putative Splicing factor 3A subunit 3 [Blattamonas nauphoetae]